MGKRKTHATTFLLHHMRVTPSKSVPFVLQLPRTAFYSEGTYREQRGYVVTLQVSMVERPIFMVDIKAEPSWCIGDYWLEYFQAWRTVLLVPANTFPIAITPRKSPFSVCSRFSPMDS
ncbi:unnamed protein product [Ectocarpus sp. 12 AP-2014]